jgi:hypothetical protein
MSHRSDSLALGSTVSKHHEDGVRALRVRVKSGRDRRTLVFRDLFHELFDGFVVGKELTDEYGEVWAITKIELTTVLGTIPIPHRAANPVPHKTA